MGEKFIAYLNEAGNITLSPEVGDFIISRYPLKDDEVIEFVKVFNHSDCVVARLGIKG